MRTRNLALLLAGCALFASWPIFVWAFARFGWIDERFVASLGSLTFSLPVALAAAALGLVAHGLMVNSELYDLLELDEDVDEDEQIAIGRAAAVASASAPVPVGAAASAGPNVVTVSGGTATASAAPAASAAAAPAAVDAEPAEEAPSKYGNKMAVAERKNQGFKDKSGKPKKAKRARRLGKSMANRGKYTAKNAVARKLRDSLRMPRF
ncbi:MAG: hypothetical protein WD378_04175 [Egicoccus sp.]